MRPLFHLYCLLVLGPCADPTHRRSSTIRIGVENTSSSPIDFVKITFADSLATAAQAYLAENELAPTEAFELEGESVHRPVFRWDGSPQTVIAPGASHIFEIQCRGKIGWCVTSR